MKEKEWIKELKKGDKVIVCLGGYGNNKRVATVNKITPKGFIEVDGYLYKQDGSVRGKGWRWLKQATDEVLEEIRRNEVVKSCWKLIKETEKLGYEQATAIIKILEVKK